MPTSVHIVEINGLAIIEAAEKLTESVGLRSKTQ